MAVGDNNPRVFAELITIDAWRTRFQGERAEADLHIDVVFGEKGRVGGVAAPVRFRLSLRRAEVHVIRDTEGILQINRQSILRSPLRTGKATTVREKTIKAAAGINAGLSQTGITVDAKTQAAGTMSLTDKLESDEDVRPLEVTHWKTDKGYSFRIEPRYHGRLRGQPWPAEKPVMKLRDTNHHRKRGEPPEVRIELHCLREDLIIENIEFSSPDFPAWIKLPRAKQLAVEQYIKEELARAGLSCGNLSEPFARLVLGDVVPVEE